MKRIKAACICQTLHFMLKQDVAHDWAVKQGEQDVEQTAQPDGSIMLKVIKQYNSSPVGDYLNWQIAAHGAAFPCASFVMEVNMATTKTPKTVQPKKPPRLNC